eukprot:TRINITY_DN49631_c0_g1_i1.p1 TRINITY_DN49631_c0_g1~~TRINITY_DN49631_c0_g1_i1.p1  ORF type:complete len:458 (+),score=130.57 TRINITY_DN49631_c0_g1_i1:136-1374(+)
MLRSLVGSEMCIRDSINAEYGDDLAVTAMLATIRSSLKPGVAIGVATGHRSLSTQVLVIGGGRMGGMRLEMLSHADRAEVAGFVDPSPEVRESVAAKFNVPTFESIDQAVSSRQPDAAWVCAPTPSHVGLIKAAAGAGMHVAVEKPVAASLLDIIDCYDTCDAADKKLFCSFQRRFDPSYLALADKVHGGTIGAPLVVHTVFRDSPCPPVEFLKLGGDPFHDLFVHDIDYVRFLLGPEDRAVEVLASGTSFIPELRAIGVMDTAVTRVKFESGAVYNGEFTRSSTYGYDQRCEVYGSSGSMARIDNPSKTECEVFDGRGAVRDQIVYSFLDRYPAAYKNEVEHFLDVIEDKAELRVNKTDATMATVLSEAALQSAKKDTVVKIRYPEGELPEFEAIEMVDGQPSLTRWSSSF